MPNNNKIKLVTHNGSFHADDLFACAILSIIYPNIEIFRTRDEEAIKGADIVVDVGGIYDADKNRYDHHQRGGAGKRENGIPYASLGLVWKHFGPQLCNNNDEIWNLIERKIVMSLDAVDNGVEVVKESIDSLLPYTADQVFLSFSPTWKEGEENIDKTFLMQVKKAKELMEREIEVAATDIEGKNIIMEAVKNSEQKEIVVIERSLPRYLYQNTLAQIPDVFFAILPSESKKGWKVEAIRKNTLTMESRKYFPASWAGLNNEELQKVSGVATVNFCHNGRFLCGALERDDALKLANIALNS